jgi:hypothetical protein
MNFGITYNNWSEEGYQELQKKYNDGHVVGRNLEHNPKNMLGPEKVAKYMCIQKNLEEVERIKEKILQIIKYNPFDKSINKLKNEIAGIAKNSGVVDPVKASFDRNINKIRQEMNNKKVKYARKGTTVSDLKRGVQMIFDEYYIKIEIIGKNKNELEKMLKNEKENKHLQERSLDELKKDDIIAFVKEWEKLKEIIGKCDNNINCIEKQIDVLDSGNVNTPSERDQKLAAAVECCQNLDQLHAFADGNVRTATLVLNKFLIELGEYPCIFDNPNVLGLKSIRELVQYTKEGQERFKSYINGEELTLPHVP